MLRAREVMLLVVMLASHACRSRRPADDSRPAADPVPTTPLPAQASAPDAPPPIDAPTACDHIRARFAAELANASGTCTTDGDCGCYNPVAGGGCGGVTDAASANKLYTIQRDFHAASCAWGINCAPWRCEPKCTAGRCAER